MTLVVLCRNITPFLFCFLLHQERLLTLKRAYGYYEEGDTKMKSRRSAKKPPPDGDTATEDSSGIDGEAMETDEASTRDQTDK